MSMKEVGELGYEQLGRTSEYEMWRGDTMTLLGGEESERFSEPGLGSSDLL